MKAILNTTYQPLNGYQSGDEVTILGFLDSRDAVCAIYAKEGYPISVCSVNDLIYKEEK